MSQKKGASHLLRSVLKIRLVFQQEELAHSNGQGIKPSQSGHNILNESKVELCKGMLFSFYVMLISSVFILICKDDLTCF